MTDASPPLPPDPPRVPCAVCGRNDAAPGDWYCRCWDCQDWVPDGFGGWWDAAGVGGGTESEEGED